jgi:hypothetical protein
MTTDLTEVCCEDAKWEALALNRVQQWVLALGVLNLRGLLTLVQNTGKVCHTSYK